jgi:hypothetical protein
MATCGRKTIEKSTRINVRKNVLISFAENIRGLD